MTHPLDEIADLTEQIDALTRRRTVLIERMKRECVVGPVVVHDGSLPAVTPDEPPSREVL